MSALETAPDARDEQIRTLQDRLSKAEAEIASLQKKVPLDGERIAKEARRRFLRFMVDRVNPGYQDRHRGDLSSWDRELFQEAGKLGLIGFNAPVELGGEGHSSAVWNLTLEELGKLAEDPGFLVIVQIQKNWAKLIHRTGRQDLIDAYAKPMLRGDLSLAWAIWEPADPSFMHSVARKVEGGWKLNASKPMLTGGWYASVYAVVVRDEASSEPMLFLVERGDPGVQVDFLPTVGAHHVGFASLTLKDVVLPDHRLAVETDAIATTSQLFNDGIIDAVTVHLGWTQRIFGLCATSLRSKVRFGQSVLDIPHVQAELGRLSMGIELSRSIFLRTIERYRQGENDPMAEPLTAIFKHYVTECALDVARTAMTLQGAPGYMDEAPWGRYMMHELCLLHAAGSQDLIPQQLGARTLMDMEMKRLRKVGL